MLAQSIDEVFKEMHDEGIENPEILDDALDIILFANTIDEVLSPLKN